MRGGVVLVVGVMAVAGAAVMFAVSSKRSADGGRWRAQMAADIEQGGMGGLGRAQALGRRLALDDPGDREAAAALALANAMLAVDYGFPVAPDTELALDRAAKGAPPAASDAVAADAAAARALLLLRAGDRQGAARQAAAAASAAPGLPHPLYALGRARALDGDLAGARRALEAAIVASPGFATARAAWAEVLLDLGGAGAATARATLEELVARWPGDGRARLLLDEAEQALGAAPARALAGACGPVEAARASSSLMACGCGLAEAARLRRAGMRPQARSRAEAAALLLPDEPRLQARAATLLAELGAVDRAAGLLERARRRAAPGMPAVAWASAAVALGQGRAAPLPAGPRPSDPAARLLVARAALAAGGVDALAATLDDLGTQALAEDGDLRLLARLRRGAGGPTEKADAQAPADPLRAYVDGLRLRLDGALLPAAASLGRALSGHGEACRAAGESIAVWRALGRHVDPAAFGALRAENARCVNLPR